MKQWEQISRYVYEWQDEPASEIRRVKATCRDCDVCTDVLISKFEVTACFDSGLPVYQALQRLLELMHTNGCAHAGKELQKLHAWERQRQIIKAMLRAILRKYQEPEEAACRSTER